MTALDLTTNWPVPNASALVVQRDEIVSTAGDVCKVQQLASLSKPICSWAILVAIEEGVITLETPLGQTGCTLRHLLSHAGGYPFDDPAPTALPERKRIYSNTGFDLAAAAVEQATAMTFSDYLQEAVLAPLGMNSSTLAGPAASGMIGSTQDVGAFIQEVRSPTLVHPSTAAEALRVQYAYLAGTVPGVGRYDLCPWGLGFEIRGAKQPHWTGKLNSELTYGHFGAAGTMFWIDPAIDLALVALADLPFDKWALSAWPELSDAVIEEYA